MRVIAPSALIFASLLCAPLPADTQGDIVDLFASMAAALSEINVPQFMDAFDKNMPDYDRLKAEVAGLVNQGEISSSVEPLKNEGGDTGRVVDLDWYLEIRSLLPDGPLVRRREVVHCELRKEKKHWKIVSLKPLDFFAPAKLDQ